MATLLLTTNPGIEDLVEAELHAQAAARGFTLDSVEPKADGWRGRVRLHADVPMEILRAMALQLPCIHHVMAPVWEGALPDADDVPEALGAIARAQDWSALLDAQTLRGTCDRYGEHSFGSPEVEAHVGGNVSQLSGVKVKLKGWDVAVRCDVRHDRAFMAVQYTQRSVTLTRLARPYMPRTALKPTMAWALWRLALADGLVPKRVLDPFMGSGSLLLEAALVLPEAELIGSDSYAKHIVGAGQNLEAAGAAEGATLVCTDVRQLAKAMAEVGIEPGTIDAVVTNPPYGMRLGARTNFTALYTSVLRELHTMLRPGGRVVLMAMKRRTFTQVAARHKGFKMLHVRAVETGGISPAIYVLERQPAAD